MAAYGGHAIGPATIAASLCRIFAGRLTSVLPTTSTEVRRKEAIRERFRSRPPAEQYSDLTQNRQIPAINPGAAGLQRNQSLAELAEREGLESNILQCNPQ